MNQIKIWIDTKDCFHDLDALKFEQLFRYKKILLQSFYSRHKVLSLLVKFSKASTITFHNGISKNKICFEATTNYCQVTSHNKNPFEF